MKNTGRFLALALCAVIILGAAAEALAAKYDIIPYGESSLNVRTMQTALKRKGFYKGVVDGKFGPSTRTAVYKFQSSIGIKADGKPGDRTLNALYHGTSSINQVGGEKYDNVEVKNPNTLYYGCTGPRVSSLQRALKALGYFKGRVDGKFGDLTLAAVKRFQKAKGMHVDGLAGPATIARINKAQTKAKVSTSFLMSVGSKGYEVDVLQVRLKGMGYSIGGDAAGYYGKGTSDAIKEYQRKNGLTPTGNTSQSLFNRIVVVLPKK